MLGYLRTSWFICSRSQADWQRQWVCACHSLSDRHLKLTLERCCGNHQKAGYIVSELQVSLILKWSWNSFAFNSVISECNEPEDKFSLGITGRERFEHTHAYTCVISCTSGSTDNAELKIKDFIQQLKAPIWVHSHQSAVVQHGDNTWKSDCSWGWRCDNNMAVTKQLIIKGHKVPQINGDIITGCSAVTTVVTSLLFLSSQAHVVLRKLGVKSISLDTEPDGGIVEQHGCSLLFLHSMCWQ